MVGMRKAGVRWAGSSIDEGGAVDRTDLSNRNTRIVVLLSGGGRTLANLLTVIREQRLSLQVVHVISTRRTVAGNDVARDAGLPLSIIRRRDVPSDESFSDAVFKVIDDVRADLVVCAGFLSKLVVPDRFMGKVVNIHPSILPLFGGRGYYGDAVHQAVLESGMRVSGCTVHFVDNAYDAGPIIAQSCVPVSPEDDVRSLATRVFNQECAIYPSVINDVASGRIQLDGTRVRYHQAAMETNLDR
jgi:phosphoribosylglycinamide formyltransferase 1